ncbi:MAG TPA: hypothetical protein VH593_01920 [Ktedonobacteraceae bacterium]
MPTIACVDPGATCGIALYDDGVVQLLQMTRGNDVRNANKVLEVCGGPEVLVVERFVPQPTKGYTWQSLSPMRIGAMLECLIAERGLLVDLLWQTPSDKAVITDDRLRRWGWWWPGHDDAMDALRHLIVFLRRTKMEWRDLEVSHVAVD